jgi:cell wall-associated NlpC family hydrolase
MPSFRLAGNPGSLAIPAGPGPGKAALRAAANLVRERAAALARSRQKVTAVSAVLTGLQTQAEVATERYDLAVAIEQQAAASYQAAAARLAVARRTQAASRSRVAGQAAADFEAQGTLGPMAMMFGGPGGPGAYLNALGVEQVLASHRTDALASDRADSAVATVFSEQAGVLLAQKQAAAAQVAALQLAAQAAVDRQVTAVKAAKSAQGQAAALLAIARTNSAKLEAEHRAAVAAQLRAAEIGKPYQWGAIGPATYDCSGLAMDAWARAGIRLGHYTGWQWPAGPHVPIGQLRRGDLVFYATNTADPATIHHVGIYIGGGMMVDAPFTGAFVRIDSIYQFAGLIGATRPAN